MIRQIAIALALAGVIALLAGKLRPAAGLFAAALAGLAAPSVGAWLSGAYAAALFAVYAGVLA